VHSPSIHRSCTPLNHTLRTDARVSLVACCARARAQAQELMRQDLLFRLQALRRRYPEFVTQGELARSRGPQHASSRVWDLHLCWLHGMFSHPVAPATLALTRCLA
jgi:hypothetical protein